MTRPLAVVYQQLAAPSTVAAIPDLGTVLVGPAYDLFDYPDDAATTLLSSTYGRLEQPAGGADAYTPPTSGTDAVTVAAYPGISPGARVTHGSVRLYLGLPRVILATTQAGQTPALGVGMTYDEDDRTLLTFSGGDLVAAGVRPGDRVVMTSSRGTQTTVRTVATVGEPNAAGLATDVTLLRVTAALPTPDTKATGRITAFPAVSLGGVQATASITCNTGAATVDGDTFTLDDGVNAATVFEFDSGGGVTGANVAVAFVGAETAAQMRDLVVAAINGVGATLRITAAPGALGVVTLTSDFYATCGNTAIVQSAASLAAITTPFAGGVGGTFTLDDGDNPATVFEFSPGGAVVGANVPVVHSQGMTETAAQVRDLLVTAINGVVGTLLITAAPSGTAYVDLTADVGGAEGNVTITETVLNAGFVVTGMTGGASSTTSWHYWDRGEGRIERTLATQEFVDADHTYLTFPVPGSDALVIRGGLTRDVTISPVASVATPTPATSVVTLTVSYATLYLAYAALRQDLQELAAVTQDDVVVTGGVTRVGAVGKKDARNPLAAALFAALQNSGTAPIWYFGVPSDDASGHTVARAALAARRDLHARVLLTSDPAIIVAHGLEADTLADPDTALADGVPQRFCGVIGAGTLPVATTVFDGGLNGVAQQPGTSTGVYRTLTIALASAVSVIDVLPGDTVILGLPSTGAPTGWQNRRGAHVVSHLNHDYTETVASNLELVPGSSRWDDTVATGAGDVEVLVRAPDGTVKVSVLASLDTTQNGGTITWQMLAPTTLGGPYTVRYVAGSVAAVTLAGFAITVTYVTGMTTHANVCTLVAAHATLSTLLTATWDSVGTVINGVLAAAPIELGAGDCTCEVIVNDNLFDRLEDAGATFLTSGVLPGDLIEVPVDTADYGPDAFAGRLLTYVVGQVLNEQRLLLANGRDDTGSAAYELPHFYQRDYASTAVDNTAPNAIRYRVRRALDTDAQVESLVSLAQGFRSKRVTLAWPDEVLVADLVDGSLPRTDPLVPTAAGWQPGWYLGAVVGGALAGLPVQHGLTNLGFAGIRRIRHSNGYFSEPQLTRLSDGGWFVFHQPRPTDLPSCIHQLTTDTTAVETGELSVVRNIDYISIFVQTIVEEFLGQYNVLPETSNAIASAITDGFVELKGRKLNRVGAPLTEGSVTQITAAARDRYKIYLTAGVPSPLNNADIYLVV